MNCILNNNLSFNYNDNFQVTDSTHLFQRAATSGLQHDRKTPRQAAEGDKLLKRLWHAVNRSFIISREDPDTSQFPPHIYLKARTNFYTNSGLVKGGTLTESVIEGARLERDFPKIFSRVNMLKQCTKYKSIQILFSWKNRGLYTDSFLLLLFFHFLFLGRELLRRRVRF